ncbi:MAG: L-histidine N(alpha)-methyltransferase [Actinomycetota bacterium]|nr:L-histidine N(alpha)-methyltransferase [Actinomycetota bacterium]
MRHLSDVRSLREQLADDVRTGLTGRRKALPPKYFYDARGSALFERITGLPEYYLTRAEAQILRARAGDIVRETRPVELVELGSGSARKTRLLLDAMHDVGTGSRYVALDVSEAALRGAADRLAADLPWLEVDGLVGDFRRDLPAIPRSGRRLLVFLGSTIGNLDRGERAALLEQVALALHGGDHFLLGVDLVKDPSVLRAAYDDRAGVTAAFNRNLISVLNRELGAQLPPDAFEHVARYDEHRASIEMSLRASRDISATFPDLRITVRFTAGEELHTESSYKFTRSQVVDELAGAGLRLQRWDTDRRGRFALALARPVDQNAGLQPAP